MSPDDHPEEPHDPCATLLLLRRISDVVSGPPGTQHGSALQLDRERTSVDVERHVAYLERLGIVSVARDAQHLRLTLRARALRMITPATPAGRAWRSVAAHAVADRAYGTCQALLDVLAERDPLA